MKIKDEFGVEYDATLINSEDEPYLEYEYKRKIMRYNPKYGDNRMCVCGHPYYRHFDSYEDMEPCGCKYCGCYHFVEATPKAYCKLCNKPIYEDNIEVCNSCSEEYKF